MTKEDIDLCSIYEDEFMMYPYLYEEATNYININLRNLESENIKRNFAIQCEFDIILNNEREIIIDNYDTASFYIPVTNLNVKDALSFYDIHSNTSNIDIYLILDLIFSRYGKIYTNKYAVLDLAGTSSRILRDSSTMRKLVDDMYLLDDESKNNLITEAIEYITDKLLIDYKTSISNSLNESINTIGFFKSNIIDNDRLNIQLNTINAVVVPGDLVKTIIKHLIYFKEDLVIHIEADSEYYYLDEFYNKKLNKNEA